MDGARGKSLEKIGIFIYVSISILSKNRIGVLCSYVKGIACYKFQLAMT